MKSKFKTLIDYKIECSLNKETPLLLKKNNKVYRINYEDMTYSCIDLLLNGYNKRGKFIKIKKTFLLY